MDPIIGSAIIAAGSRLVGGLFNNNAQKSAQNAANASADADRAFQKEFAQHGISWKVADAKAAGLSPLAALGTNTPFYSPVNQSFNANTSIGDTFADMGQDISRALMAKASNEERIKSQMAELMIERGNLENSILRSKLAKLNSAQIPPGNPAPLVPVQVAPAKDIVSAHGSFKTGPGTTADSVEEIYGGAAGEIEGFPRYLRDKWNSNKQRFMSPPSVRADRDRFWREVDDAIKGFFKQYFWKPERR